MRTSLISSVLIVVALWLAGCGSKEGTTSGKVIKSAPAGNNLTVSLSTSDGVLKHGNTEFTLTFADPAGKPIDVGAVALTFHMPQMGSMAAMNDAATLTTTDTPGVYGGKASIQMAGEWQVRISYEGPAGRGNPTFSVTAQ